MLEEYVVITWPESQHLQNKKDFIDNSYLISDLQGIEDFGYEAYFVNKEWYNKNCN